MKTNTPRNYLGMAIITISATAFLNACSNSNSGTTVKTTDQSQAAASEQSWAMQGLKYKAVRGAKSKALSSVQKDALNSLTDMQNTLQIDQYGNEFVEYEFSDTNFNKLGRYLEDLARSASEKGTTAKQDKVFSSLQSNVACLSEFSEVRRREREDQARDQDFHVSYHELNDENVPAVEFLYHTDTGGMIRHESATQKLLQEQVLDVKPLQGTMNSGGRATVSLNKSTKNASSGTREAAEFRMSYKGATHYRNCRSEPSYDNISYKHLMANVVGGSEVLSQLYDTEAELRVASRFIDNLAKEAEALEAAKRELSQIMDSEYSQDPTKAPRSLTNLLAKRMAEIEANETRTKENKETIERLSKKHAALSKAYVDAEINRIGALLDNTYKTDGKIYYAAEVRLDASADPLTRNNYFEISAVDTNVYESSIDKDLRDALEGVDGNIQVEFQINGDVKTRGFDTQTKKLAPVSLSFDKLTIALHLPVQEFKDLLTYSTDQLLSKSERKVEMKKILERSAYCAGEVSIDSQKWDCREFVQWMIDDIVNNDDDDMITGTSLKLQGDEKQQEETLPANSSTTIPADSVTPSTNPETQDLEG